MNKKAQELELRNIMQGLEEFATFMSFKSNSAGLRILSVESVTHTEPVKTTNRTARVIKIHQPAHLHIKQSLSEPRSFHDRKYH
tara:strand:- start:1966 stop:2217 length:252 start_codon:yes stop_codon:yes gene_type:complete